jgi:hypothetical protein
MEPWREKVMAMQDGSMPMKDIPRRLPFQARYEIARYSAATHWKCCGKYESHHEEGIAHAHR